MELSEILSIAARVGASDIHLKSGLPPMYRVQGRLLPLADAPRLAPADMDRHCAAAMTPSQRARLETSTEIDFALSMEGLGRFRANAFHQRGAIGLALRVIPSRIATIRELLLPRVLEEMALEERGLILATGTTSSGKSTTLAAMIDHINSTQRNHILTIEDPIEFLITEKLSIVNQREVGLDSGSFGHALRAALRQDPDVILVGEMRDHETIDTALAAAETGHLVLSTLHTIDATETINRVLAVFPPHQQRQVRIQLASVLRGVISQRLVERADGKGRVPAVEVLRMTAHVRELIEDADRTRELPDAITQGHVTVGMQTMDQSLMQLVHDGVVSIEEATRQASNPADFALRLSGVSSTSDSKWDDFDGTAGAERNVAERPARAAMPARPATPAPPARSQPTPGSPAERLRRR
jgi:twitching motility protein PilT